MVNAEPDVDPQNIKPLTNEELTKLIVISNRMLGRMSNQVAAMQSQINELAKIILEARIIDTAKFNTLVDQLHHVAEQPSEQTFQKTDHQIIDLPMTPLNPSDLGLMGVSVTGGGEAIVLASVSNQPAVVQEEKTIEQPVSEVDSLTDTP